MKKDVFVNEYIIPSGMTYKKLIQTDQGKEFVNLMHKKIDRFLTMLPDRRVGVTTYNGKRYYHPKTVIQIEWEEKNGFFQPYLSKLLNYQEYTQNKFDKIQKTSAPQHEWDAMHIMDRILYAHGILLVSGNNKADYPHHVSLYKQLLSFPGYELHKTHNPAIVLPVRSEMFEGKKQHIDFTYQDLFNAFMFPMEDTSMEKIIGGRLKNMLSPKINDILPGTFDDVEWIVKDDLGETIVFTFPIEVKIGDDIHQVASGKIVSGHIKGMFITDYNLSPDGRKIAMVGKDAIKGKYFNLGFRLTEAHLGFGMYADYKSHRTKVSLDSWHMFYMIHNDEILSMVKDDIALYANIINGTANLKQVKSIFTHEQEPILSFQVFDRALSTLEVAEAFLEKGIINEEQANRWTMLPEVRRGVLRIIDKKLRSLEVHVPSAQGKIYTVNEDRFKDGKVYVLPQHEKIFKQFDCIARHPAEYPVKVEFITLDESYHQTHAGCVPFFMNAKTASVIGGDGDGDLINAVSSKLFIHALKFNDALYRRTKAIEATTKEISKLGAATILEKLKFKLLPGYTIDKNGLYTKPIKSVANHELHWFYKSQGPTSIGSADKAIWEVLMNLSKSMNIVERLDDVSQYIWRLFFIKQNRIEAQKNPSELVVHKKDGEIQFHTDPARGGMPRLRPINDSEVWHLANTFNEEFNMPAVSKNLDLMELPFVNEFVYLTSLMKDWWSVTKGWIDIVSYGNDRLREVYQPILDIELPADSIKFSETYGQLNITDQTTFLIALNNVAEKIELNFEDMFNAPAAAINQTIAQIAHTYLLSEDKASLAFALMSGLDADQLLDLAKGCLKAGGDKINFILRANSIVRLYNNYQKIEKLRDKATSFEGMNAINEIYNLIFDFAL